MLVLLGLFVVLLVHSAHRFRYTLYDGLQIKAKGLTALLCYGGAPWSVAAVAFLTLALLLERLGLRPASPGRLDRARSFHAPTCRSR